MPIALDPDQTIDIWLPSDDGKPPATRPTFVARFCSARERRRIRQLRDEAIADGTTDDAFFAKVNEALRVGITGWRNMGPHAFADGFDGPLTAQEMYELVGVHLERTRLAEDDLKNSRSPAAGGGAASAPAAPPAGA